MLKQSNFFTDAILLSETVITKNSWAYC